MIKCVVFDFDGTLVQSNEIKRKVFYQVVQEYGNFDPIVDATLNELASADRFSILARIASVIAANESLPNGMTCEDVALSLTDEYSRVCEVMIAGCEEVGGASELLKALSDEGIALFINSATPYHPLKRIIELRSFDKYFLGVYGNLKDKVRNLREIMKVTCSDPSELIFIGDSEADRHAAETIGCYFIGIISNPDSFAFRPAFAAHNLIEAKLIMQEEMGLKFSKSGIAK